MKGRTRLLLGLILAAYTCGIAAAACENVTVADIVFLVDGSSSITAESFQEVRRFLRQVINTVDIGPDNVRIGLAQYSDEPFKEFLLKDHTDKDSLLAAVDRLSHRGGGTETGKAIKFLQDQYFTEEAGSRASQRVPQIALVITDGDSTDDVAGPAQLLRQYKDGVVVFAIGVGDLNKEKLMTIPNYPPGRFMFTINNYRALQSLTDSLLKTVCISLDDQRRALENKFADIFYLVDSGIARGRQTSIQSDINKMIEEGPGGASAYRFGLAQYGQDVNVQFNLNTYQTKEEMLDGVGRFRLRPQGSRPRLLNNALQYAESNFFTRQAGGRADQGTPQYLVLVLGDTSVDTTTIKVARRIKSAGGIVVGVSAGASMDVINRLSTYGYAVDYTHFTQSGIKDLIMTEKKEDITEECKGANVADIVFVVDESGSITTPNFQLMRSFLHSVVKNLDVGLTKVRVGMVTYNTAPIVQFYLDKFNNQAEILQFINMLPHRRGGTNIGLALNFTREKVFTERRGTRKGVQKVAIVITDGQSDDSVTTAASFLRRADVTVFAIGIKGTDGANMSELIEIASHPPSKYVFEADDFTKLSLLRQNLQKTMCKDIINKVIEDPNKDPKDCIKKEEADIFFLIDDSGSIENTDFNDTKKFIYRFIKSFHIGPEHIRMGVVKYSDKPSLQFDLTKYSNAEGLMEAVKNIHHAGGGTKTGDALSAMVQHFEAHRRANVPEYLIVITDGESADSVKVPAEKLRERNIQIHAIGVKDANETELIQIAGDSKRISLVTNFDALKSISTGIIKDICAPDECKDVQSDVFFLIDSSESIEEKDFQKMKDFMKTIIMKSAIGQDQVHFGVMQFSSKVKLEFRLDEFYSKDEMLNAIDAMQPMFEGTLTGKGITEVSRYFDKGNGGRPDVSQKLIVITDGKSHDEVKGPAEALRRKQVMIYAIGVGDGRKQELEQISGAPDRVYSERNFDALSEVQRRIPLDLCRPEECERSDMIFLVDVSTSINSAEFRSMQMFLQTMVNRTTVGKDLTRVGVILYATNPKSSFTLKDYHSKRKVLEAISNLEPFSGLTLTSKALKYSLQFFNAEHGGRKARKVPQILMVITDGRAQDRADLKATSDALRGEGVIIFSIGVGNTAQDQLNTMAGDDPSKVFHVENYNALGAAVNRISHAVCNSTKPVCKNDLVLLLDRSGSIIKKDYNIMLNFTAELVKSFEVSEEFMHVGLAQFSAYLQHEFYLNTTYNKDDMIDHIKNMELKGGDTKIGEALTGIEGYFKASSGSRKGVPKNLLLISDGDSHDDVEDPAELLRNQGINVFSIGVGNINELKLLQICGTPERMFSVWSYENMINIKKKLVDEMCKTEPPEYECSIDIAFGFDISRRTGAPNEKLVSGHNKLQTFLKVITRAVSSARSLCCTGTAPVETNIAFHIVGRDGRSLYDTRFEGYNEAVVEKVMSHRLSEPTYFNRAQLNYFKETFQDPDRAKVKVVVIFSDGLDEDVMEVEQESELLRQSGVSALLTVALQGARDPAQLQMVEFGRGFGYKLPLSIGMQSVGSTILEQIDAVSSRECCNVLCRCSGHEGSPGGVGSPGSKGSPGPKGQPGHPGDEGAAGERGPPGPDGPPGIQGCPGTRGQKGSRGVSGDRGEDGEDGVDGVDGEQGTTGADGARGERGPPGDLGIPGIRGGAGPKGQRGLRGDPGAPGTDNTISGPKGDPGNPGLPGRPGPDGRPGGDGVLGNPGPDGRRGAIGEKGAPGGPGVRGLPGIPGAQGPQGRRGGTGERGPKGLSGFPGRQGEPGTAGDPGPDGRRGPNGQKGQPGEPGAKGAPGSQGSRGMPGQDGRDGYGPPGPKGAKGDPGFPGYPGLPGEDGLEGTKGYPGRKGNKGRGGDSGRPGDSGLPGGDGYAGRKGLKGPPGGRSKTECELITFIRDNCACSSGESKCPAYPTELVFGLDMSEGVTQAVFDRQRSALLSMLEDITVAESNCPTGARVAVMGYNEETSYLIRFQDYRTKKDLIQAVRNIAQKRPAKPRQLGAAMRFVGHNVFKRVRAGVRVRKVAVFFANGPSQDIPDVTTAVMEYQGLNIVPAVIALRNTAPISRAMEVDDTGKSIYIVLGSDMAELWKVKSCAICYDPCRRSEQCNFIQDPVRPQEVDVDLVMVVDGSREMQADEYAGAQQLLVSVVDQLAVSPQPRRAGNQARVAVVQQSGTRLIKPEFGLQTYQNQALMRRHLIQTMRQQGGSSALGQTLDFTLREVLLKAPQPRKKRALLTVVGTQTAYEDRAKLHYISQKAKCEGVALFVVTVGERYNRTQVEELAGLPVQQHLIHVDRLKADERGYAQRFFRVFLTALSKGINPYPPPALRRTCGLLVDPDETLFTNGQGSAEPVEDMMADEGERFEEQTGGQTWTTQLDVVNTLTRRDDRSSPSGGHLSGACLLRRDYGACKNNTIAWFFNSERGRCFPFWYSGCGGNGNRFETRTDCEKLCQTSVEDKAL